MEEKKVKIKYDWNELSCDEKDKLIKIADGLGIPPNFVQEMYENGQLAF